ncbi:MAG TPA: hypothetical protein VF214_05945, partial [Edaphobacter sp.]
ERWNMDRITALLGEIEAQRVAEPEPGQHLRAFLRDCRAQSGRPEPDEVLEVAHSDETLPVSTILKAAAERAPYRRPKLAVVGNAYGNGADFASLLDKAVLRSEAVREPKLISPSPAKPAPGKSPEAVSAEAMGKGFQEIRRRPL